MNWINTTTNHYVCCTFQQHGSYVSILSFSASKTRHLQHMIHMLFSFSMGFFLHWLKRKIFFCCCSFSLHSSLLLYFTSKSFSHFENFLWCAIHTETKIGIQKIFAGFQSWYIFKAQALFQISWISMNKHRYPALEEANSQLPVSLTLKKTGLLPCI